MPSREPSAEPFANIRTDSGTFVVEYLGDGIARCRFSGHFTKDFAEHVIEQATRLRLRHGVVHVFHDWWELRRHDADARAHLSRWALETRGDRESVHILVNVSSPILAMAVTVTNMVLNGVVKVHESRSTFERELTLCLQARRANR